MPTLKIGVMTSLSHEPEQEIQKVRDFGLPCCQLGCWDPTRYTDEIAERVRQACRKSDVAITTVWAGYSGPAVWNFIDGPCTIGLVPRATRTQRVRELQAASDFARKIGAPSITTHVGFLPEWPGDPEFAPTVEAIRQVALRCKDNGQLFCFETGQETPITLLRTIQAVGTDNLAINLDPANLLLYGKANPVDALDIFGQYVRGVHAKDGEYPTDGNNLGREKPLGQGRVNFPVLIPKLKACGFTGALTIEREISGPQQIADIKMAIRLLQPLC